MFHVLLSFQRKPLALLLFGCLLAFLMAPGQLAHAQNPTTAWVAHYHSPSGGYNSATAMAVDAQGNVYVTGGSEGAATVKYNASGQQLWVALYHTPNGASGYFKALALDAQGNVYVTGRSTEQNNTDYATVKYNANGQQIWAARYHSSPPYIANDPALAVDSQGNVYVTGASDDDCITIKYDTNGQQIWVARYAGGGGSAIALDVQGNVYITGVAIGINGERAYLTIKYDTNGHQLWVARYADGDGSALALAVDAQGNIYVTGTSSVRSVLIKYDANGQQLWIERDNGGAGGRHSLAVDTQGNVYIIHNSEGDYVTIKYDTNGQQLWVERYNGQIHGFTGAEALAVDAQGNVYVTGGLAFAGGSRIGDADYVTIKYSQTPPALVPSITGFAPTSVAAGVPDFALTVRGTGFVPASVVQWNLLNLPTTYVSSIELRVGVPASFIANPGAAAINVVNPPGDLAHTSNTAYFAITQPNPANITSQTTVTRSGFRYVRTTGHYVQTVTVRNASLSAYSGPLHLVLDSLSANAALFNRIGLTTYYLPLASPYVSNALASVGNGDSVFNSGESVTFMLEFANPTNAAITYTPRVLAGSGTP